MEVQRRTENVLGGNILERCPGEGETGRPGPVVNQQEERIGRGSSRQQLSKPIYPLHRSPSLAT